MARNSIFEKCLRRVPRLGSRTNQIDDRFFARHISGMNRVRRQKVSITCAQGVRLMTDAKFKRPTNDPVRLIFSMRVRTILCAWGIGPLKYAVAFALQTLPEPGRVRSAVSVPFFHLNTHRRSIAPDEPASGDSSVAREFSNSMRTSRATSQRRPLATRQRLRSARPRL